MVLTLELPIRHIRPDPFSAYESRFGDLPSWLDELGAAEAHLRLGEREQARSLVRQVLAGKPDMAEAKALLQRIDG